MKSSPLFLGIAALAVAAAGVMWVRSDHPKLSKPVVNALRAERNLADSSFLSKPETAKAEYAKFVDRRKADPSPKVQDEVGDAEIRLGYLAAQKGDFETGRKEFLAAAKIQGTGAMGADFGGITDQAAYEAAVCLAGEHKDAEAKAAFRDFLKQHQLSPLVHAAHKRLWRLNGQKDDPEGNQLLQAAITAQEKLSRFETSVCGPKTIEYLMNEGLVPLSYRSGDGRGGKGGEGPPDYKSIAKLCGTTDSGTSIDGMRKGLKALGIESYGLDLNRQDLDKLQLPAILLDGDHYFAILERHGRKLVLYDTLLKSKREIQLPEASDPDFRASVISFSLPDFAE